MNTCTHSPVINSFDNVGGYETDSIMEGNIFIADISGFSDFVRKTDIRLGRKVISNLLEAIIKSDILDMKLIEIEGDALLFFKEGNRISTCDVLKQYRKIRFFFEEEIKKLRIQLNLSPGLSIKLIAHYGSVLYYSIGRFQRMYGQTIVEAHQLLKNSIPSNTYCLITDVLAPFEMNVPSRQQKQEKKSENCITKENLFASRITITNDIIQSIDLV